MLLDGAACAAVAVAAIAAAPLVAAAAFVTCSNSRDGLLPTARRGGAPDVPTPGGWMGAATARPAPPTACLPMENRCSGSCLVAESPPSWPILFDSIVLRPLAIYYR